jgi:hypothetical protein
MGLTVRLEGKGTDELRGFRYFWMKSVEGFNASAHCATCLKGEYVKSVGLHLLASRPALVTAEEGTLFYLCGVAKPYAWAKNAHLAIRVRKGATCTLHLHTGQSITIMGGEQVPFDDKAAREHYSTKSSAYLTCRNFQFGAALEHGRLNAPMASPTT